MILIGPVTLFFILLLMFKPIRRVLLWAFVVIAIFLVACWNGWIGPPAHAEMSAVVQCRIGSYAEQMPDFVCAALMKGAAKITTNGGSQVACHDETLRHIQTRDGNDAPVWNACGAIYSAKVVDQIMRRGGR